MLRLAPLDNRCGLWMMITMKRTIVPAIVFVAAAATSGCGAEAFDPMDTSQEFGASSASGGETERTIAQLETRRGTVSIESTRDGVRYGVAGSSSVSLDRLQTEEPELYEVLTRATASPLHGIDARVDGSFLRRVDTTLPCCDEAGRGASSGILGNLFAP